MKKPNIDVMILGMVHTNCYIISGRTGSAVIIDPAAGFEKIKDFLKKKNLKAEAVLLTHGHFDHHGAAAQLQKQGCKIFMSAEDINIIGLYGGILQKKFVPDILLKDNEVLSLAGFDFKVITTPGHTKGGVCFLTDDLLFSGDTLFCKVVGRTDLRGGSFETLKDSIQKKLYLLPDETIVYPGHGTPTTIGDEKKNNSQVKA